MAPRNFPRNFVSQRRGLVANGNTQLLDEETQPVPSKSSPADFATAWKIRAGDALSETTEEPETNCGSESEIWTSSSDADDKPSKKLTQKFVNQRAHSGRQGIATKASAQPMDNECTTRPSKTSPADFAAAWKKAAVVGLLKNEQPSRGIPAAKGHKAQQPEKKQLSGARGINEEDVPLPKWFSPMPVEILASPTDPVKINIPIMACELPALNPALPCKKKVPNWDF